MRKLTNLISTATALLTATIRRLQPPTTDTPTTKCDTGTCTHTWETSTWDDGDNVHVIPLKDRIEHTDTEDCICGPQTEAVFRADGSNGWLHCHHPLDNREDHQ